MTRTSKRLPFYLACGAAISALAVAGGLLATGAGATTTIQTRKTGLGQILVDGRGRTVYLFTKDTGDLSRCAGACASVWPPVPAGEIVHARGGAAAAELDTIPTKDGERQMAYAGHPLYYFIRDRHAGDTDGQGLTQFGGTWYALTPAGAPQRAARDGAPAVRSPRSRPG